MSDLSITQYLIIGLLFIWSGFVRSGLGFGGAVLTLPFLLLVVDDPLLFLPIIGVQLMLFSVLITWQSKQRVKAENLDIPVSTIDWRYLRFSLLVMIVPKLVGVFGLLTLPGHIMSAIIYGIVMVYAAGYLFNRPFRSNNRYVDIMFLMLGGYVSGTSLIGAPLIVAVFANHVAKGQLRDTLFVLWFILVLIKLASFIIAGVDMQLEHHLWLLPCAYLGHLIGEKLHQRLVAAETGIFYRSLGAVLILVSSFGLWQIQLS